MDLHDKANAAHDSVRSELEQLQAAKIIDSDDKVHWASTALALGVQGMREDLDQSTARTRELVEGLRQLAHDFNMEAHKLDELQPTSHARGLAIELCAAALERLIARHDSGTAGTE